MVSLQTTEMEELPSLLENATWALVDRKPGQNVIDTKWVYKTKLNPDGTIERYKARLVAQGEQQRAGVDFHPLLFAAYPGIGGEHELHCSSS